MKDFVKEHVVEIWLLICISAGVIAGLLLPPPKPATSNGDVLG